MSTKTQKITLFRNAAGTAVHPPGATIFSEGDEGNVMYAVKRGSLNVMVQGKIVDVIRPDEVFGEMALLEERKRSATVVTREETELVEIDEAQFFILVRHHPHFSLQMMRLLSERLRNAHALNV